MKKMWVALCAWVLLGSVFVHAEEINQLSDAEKAEGWQLLFDGKTADGWHSFNYKEVLSQWQVIDGVLTLTKGGGGDLVTDKAYGDFDLKWDWKISYRGNSGVMMHVQEGKGRKYPWLTGPEYQLLDNAHLPEGPIEQAGALFALYAPTRDVTKPTGEWNESRLLVQNGHVKHWMNGELIVEYDLLSEDFTKRVAASKFATMPEFAKFSTGGIVLQDHGDPVAFRNVKIHVLDKSKP
ncbi:MAG: DUF1080 domain-containing protein [Burkholderiaceae bacterium]|nr:DUF1080 domain-containing protein [Burkholderiaceae bacterium]